MRKFSYILIILIILLLPNATRAANLYFISPELTKSFFAPFEIEVALNTEHQLINTFDCAVTFPPDQMELVNLNDGNSIINFWIDKPTETASGTIHFSGITPGGINIDNGQLFSLTFQPKKTGQLSLQFSRNCHLYLNDGLATEAPMTTQDSDIVVRSDKLPVVTGALADYTPPENFIPEISDSLLLPGGKLLIFAAVDKGSGIDHYEVKETSLPFEWLGEWTIAESPFQLKNQHSTNYLFVKAVDKAGNYRIVQINPTNKSTWYQNLVVWCIIFVLLVLLLYFFIKKLLTGKVI